MALRNDAGDYPLDSSGLATIPLETIGELRLEALAIDAAGNRGVAAQTIIVSDPRATDSLLVTILSPTNGAVVAKRVPIIATITNSTPIQKYRVDYAPADEVDLNDIAAGAGVWTTISEVVLASSTTQLNEVTVGYFDPLTLINDTYVVRLYVESISGDGWYEPLVISTTGDLKFGEFRVAFNDLTIPLAGIPITVSRVYDSRLAHREGDFGHGWQLAIQDPMLRVGVGNQGLSPGARVYLTGPDGRRLGFTAEPQLVSALPFGLLAAFDYTFRPDVGIFERLDSDAGTQLAGFGSSEDLFEGVANPDGYTLTIRDGTRYSYSKARGLQTVTDTSGNSIRYMRDGIFHFLAGSTDSDQGIHFIRDARGRIERIIDPAGNPLVYKYDAAGDLRAFTDQVTNVTQYAYDSARAHFLTNIVDPFGKNALGLVYENGMLTKVLDAAGNPITQNFDADQNIGTFTDARGTQTLVHFDDRGNETARIIHGISTNYFAYDQNNNLISATNANGYATNFVYDARGNVIRITDALTNVTEIAYNELGKPTAVTNALGQVLRLQYNPAGQLTEVINNLGYVTRVGRDPQGRVTMLVDAVGNTNWFDYTDGCSCGRPGKVTNPDGSVRFYEYDRFGHTNAVINEVGARTEFAYFPDGRLFWVIDPMTNKTRYLYDKNRLTNIVDALGRETQFRYDDFGRTNQIITAEGGIIRFEYDANGNRTHVIDPVGNVTRFVYDAANRVTNRIDTFNRTNHFMLDAMGNQIETIDRNGRRRTFAYDALGRMTNEVWWEGSTVVKSIVFGFNELGMQILAADDVARYDYRFDALNRLDRVIQAAAGSQPEFALLYTYTANGQVESVTDNWGVTVGSKYDNRNRLERRIWQGPGVDPARVDFAYDPAGSRIRTDRYADLTGANRIGFTTNAYNVAGVVTNITHLGPAGEELARYDYDFDAAWQIRRWTINHQASTFDYDQTGQLTNAVNTAPELPDENFRYDANGNRVSAQSGGIYVTNLNNQILSDGTNTYTYDFEGNMASRSNTVTGVVTTYAWDHRNRLTTVLDYNPSGEITQTVAFVYDAMNRRLAKTVNGQTVRFFYNGDDSWADLDGGSNAVTVRYLHGARIDELLARQRASDGRGWYLADHLGSVRDLADATGEVAAHVDYSSFGQVLSVSNSTAVDRFLFTGRELDGETGLYSYRARLYSPHLGRFLSVDSIGFSPGDFNLYRYAGNLPLTLADPSGHGAIVNYLALSFGIGFVIGALISSTTSYSCPGVGIFGNVLIGGFGGGISALLAYVGLFLAPEIGYWYVTLSLPISLGAAALICEIVLHYNKP
ncbi:MAG TPA: RHS repeat-associated core domain-containing protein [Verrucomicrobiota bacterium]|nr:RHS repeat-associated core domain-containing protein [Verrucomicrobiota bacterium]